MLESVKVNKRIFYIFTLFVIIIIAGYFLPISISESVVLALLIIYMIGKMKLSKNSQKLDDSIDEFTKEHERTNVIEDPYNVNSPYYGSTGAPYSDASVSPFNHYEERE